MEVTRLRPVLTAAPPRIPLAPVEPAAGWVMSGGPQLPEVLGSLAPLPDHYGYLAIVGLIMLKDFSVPVPGKPC